MKKHLLAIALFALCTTGLNAASPKKVTPEKKGVETINRATAEAHIGFLACDELEGREAGWKGGRIAGNYIISCLKQMGIKPLLAGDYIQPFDVYHAERQVKGKRWQVHLATGEQPERTVIFAFWDGEEKGLLGSRYFAMNYPDIKKVKGYLNYDMIGRNNREDQPDYFVYFYTAAHQAFGDWLKKDIEDYRLQLSPDYRAWDNPVGGSDNGTFAKLGIPIIWYHTDAHPDYHLPGDETQKINWLKIVDITKASFLAMWKLANEKKY